MYTTTNLGLKVWDSDSDTFNRQHLIDNWEAIDDDYARARIADRVEILAAVPGAGNFDGRLVYLTAAHSGFAAKTVIRYDGSSWRAVGPTPEVFATLPTVGNFQGRVVALTSADGGFAANDVVVNTNGSTSWKKVGGIATGTSLPGSPIAGDVFLLTAAASGFPAWSTVVYTGSAWIFAERRGVENGATLPVSPYAGQVFVLTGADGGFAAYDVVRYNGSAWGKINGQASYVSGAWPGSPADGDIIIVPWGTGTGLVGQFRYNAGSGSSYKWEHIGAGPIWHTSSINSGFTVPKTGEYLVTYGINYSAVNQGNYSYVWVRDTTAAADLTPQVINGSPGTQKTGTTIGHASAGGIARVVTCTAGNSVSIQGSFGGGYSFVPVASMPFFTIQPIRVQAA